MADEMSDKAFHGLAAELFREYDAAEDALLSLEELLQPSAVADATMPRRGMRKPFPTDRAEHGKERK